MATKATSGLNHFNNQTDGAGSIFQRTRSVGMKDLTQKQADEREERVPFLSAGCWETDPFLTAEDDAMTSFMPGCWTVVLNLAVISDEGGN